MAGYKNVGNAQKELKLRIAKIRLKSNDQDVHDKFDYDVDSITDIKVLNKKLDEAKAAIDELGATPSKKRKKGFIQSSGSVVAHNAAWWKVAGAFIILQVWTLFSEEGFWGMILPLLAVAGWVIFWMLVLSAIAWVVMKIWAFINWLRRLDTATVDKSKSNGKAPAKPSGTSTTKSDEPNVFMRILASRFEDK